MLNSCTKDKPILSQNRIDKELLKRNLVPSRSKAQELIKDGFVKCNEKVIFKSNYLVKENDVLEITFNNKLKYVSRGGLKLEKAIKEFQIDFKNLKVMDIGSKVLEVSVIVPYNTLLNP